MQRCGVLSAASLRIPFENSFPARSTTRGEHTSATNVSRCALHFLRKTPAFRAASIVWGGDRKSEPLKNQVDNVNRSPKEGNSPIYIWAVFKRPDLAKRVIANAAVIQAGFR